VRSFAGHNHTSRLLDSFSVLDWRSSDCTTGDSELSSVDVLEAFMLRLALLGKLHGTGPDKSRAVRNFSKQKSNSYLLLGRKKSENKSSKYPSSMYLVASPVIE